VPASHLKLTLYTSQPSFPVTQLNRSNLLLNSTILTCHLSQPSFMFTLSSTSQPVTQLNHPSVVLFSTILSCYSSLPSYLLLNSSILTFYSTQPSCLLLDTTILTYCSTRPSYHVYQFNYSICTHLLLNPTILFVTQLHILTVLFSVILTCFSSQLRLLFCSSSQFC
jgi:hypothetical protein